MKQEVSESLAGQIIGYLLTYKNNQEAVSAEQSLSMPKGNLTRPKESIREYMNRYVLKRNPDKILAIAGFLRDCHSKSIFQTGEIRNLFRDAGEVIPGNFTRDFRWTIHNSWIAEDPDKKGNYYITNTGTNVLKK